MERAIAISVGSLSPTINWKTLRVQGFIIPSIEEQKHISKILWAADEAIEELRNCITGLQKLIKAIVNEISIKASNKGWPLKALGEIATVERGKFSHRPRNLPQFYGGQYPFVQTGDVHRANGFIKDYEYTLTDEGKKYSKSFPPGTILITIAAVIGATAITEIETWVTDSVVGIIPNDRMNLNFLEYFLRTQRHYLENVVATQTAQKNINLRILRPLQVPVPTLDTQNSIVEKLNQIQRQIIILENHIATCKKLQRSIINNMEITRV
jgi:type I restriction enzyme S subunit